MTTLLPILFAKAGETDCTVSHGTLFGLTGTWWQYLPTVTDANDKCMPALNGINDIWLIVAAIIQILLRVAAISAVFIIIYGSVLLILSQGEPQKTAEARNTIVNALVGLAVAVMAAFIVSFIAGSVN